MAKAKKALLLFVVLSMLMCSTTMNAYAKSTEVNPFICYENTYDIQPRLAYFNSVFSTISYSSGRILCQGDYTSFATGIDVTLLVALEKQSGSTWKQVRSWSRTFSPGQGSNIVGGGYSSPSSGYYRTATTALALNSKGTILEGVKVYSRTIKV